MKRTIKNLAWVAIGAANIALGYLLWTFGAWESGGLVIGIIGLFIIVDTVANMRRAKVKYSYKKGLA